MSLKTESETVELSGFKQTYFGGQLLRDYAEPALGFPALPIKRWFDITEPRPFLSIHPEASVEAQRARGKLRNPNWLTQAASLKSPDLTERKVFVTPALREIAAELGHQA